MNGFGLDRPFKSFDNDTVTTRSTMESARSRNSRDGTRKQGTARRSGGTTSSNGNQGFDEFGFGQPAFPDSAFDNHGFEMPQTRIQPTKIRSRRRASLAAAPNIDVVSGNPSIGFTNHFQSSQDEQVSRGGARLAKAGRSSRSMDGIEFPTARKDVSSQNRPRRSGRRASMATSSNHSLSASNHTNPELGYGDAIPSVAANHRKGDSNSGILDFGFGGGKITGTANADYGYGDTMSSGFGNFESMPSAPSTTPESERPRRSGRRSSISGGLESLRSDLRGGDLSGAPSSRVLGGNSRAQNIVLPMAGPEKVAGGNVRRGRRGSLLGSVGNAVGATMGGFTGGNKDKEKLDDDTTKKSKSFLKDRKAEGRRGTTRQPSADGNIISSYTGDRDRRRKPAASSKTLGKESNVSYSDRILAQR